MTPDTGQIFWLWYDGFLCFRWQTGTNESLRTLSGKGCQEAVLSGSKRGLDIWRSTLGAIIIVVIPEFEACDK